VVTMATRRAADSPNRLEVKVDGVQNVAVSRLSATMTWR